METTKPLWLLIRMYLLLYYKRGFSCGFSWIFSYKALCYTHWHLWNKDIREAVKHIDGSDVVFSFINTADNKTTLVLFIISLISHCFFSILGQILIKFYEFGRNIYDVLPDFRRCLNWKQQNLFGSCMCCRTLQQKMAAMRGFYGTYATSELIFPL